MKKFIRLFNTYNCKETSKLVSDAQERHLSVTEKIGIYIHLLICKPCVNYKQHLKFMRQAILSAKDEAAVNPDKSLNDSARDRIRQRLNQKKST